MKKLVCHAFVISLLSSALISPVVTVASNSSALPHSSWRELNYPRQIAPSGDAYYYSFALKNSSRAHVVVANLKSGNWQVRPLMGTVTKATSEFAVENNASVAINGGFFNLSNGESASYIFMNGKQVASPKENKALVENPHLQPFLETIYKRSEIRFLKTKAGKIEIQIAAHNEPLAKGAVLVDSLQAGPLLIPALRPEEEAFLRKEEDGKEIDSIGCKKTAARSAFGITADGYAIFAAVSGKGQASDSSGITLEQMAELMKHLGCSQAINLDGGASTTLYLRLIPVGTDSPSELVPGTVICGKNPETRVKSVLLLQHTQRKER